MPVRSSAIALLLAVAGLLAQPPGGTPRESTPPPRVVRTLPGSATDWAVIAEVKANAKLMANLEHLSDVIGPRVTGSPRLEKANKWAAGKMKEYGLTDVRLEPWEIPVGWERGTATVKVVEPDNGKSLIVAAAGWTPGTNGKVSGPVVVVNIRTKEDLAAYKGKLKNAVVLRGTPADVKPVTDLGYGAPPAPKRNPTDTPRPTMEEMRAFRALVTDFFRDEGVACIMIDSAKPHGLLTMTGNWPGEDRGAKPPVPTLFTAHEHYALLYRLSQAKSGVPARCEVEIANTFVPGPITVFNTVGEIKGSEKPDEFVVVGAHLDSWDLGTGTTDNGTGTCVVLETARTLAALAKQGVRPKRTIRFVLFTGEEQGLYGSKNYVKKHKDEMAKTSMALVHDTGTGKVHGLSLMGRESVKKLFDAELVALKELDGWKEATVRSSGGTDHLPFEEAGVPGFACDQDSDEYRLTHHTQSDTFDHAKAPNLIQGAQVMAVTALRVANLPDLLPRDRPDPKTK